MARVVSAESRLLYAENLTAFLMLFSTAMAAAAWHENEPSLNKATGSDAWERLRLVSEAIYENIKAVHAVASLSADAPDVDAVCE